MIDRYAIQCLAVDITSFQKVKQLKCLPHFVRFVSHVDLRVTVLATAQPFKTHDALKQSLSCPLNITAELQKVEQSLQLLTV
jgi:hypothetical protein